MLEEYVRINGTTNNVGDTVVIQLDSGNVTLTSDSNAEWSHTLTAAQLVSYNAGDAINIVCDGEHRSVAFPDRSIPRLYPAANSVLTASTQEFYALPEVSGWLYRFDIAGVNGTFGTANRFAANNLPTDGSTFPVNLRINRQDGSPQVAITQAYTSATI